MLRSGRYIVCMSPVSCYESTNVQQKNTTGFPLKKGQHRKAPNQCLYVCFQWELWCTKTMTWNWTMSNKFKFLALLISAVQCQIRSDQGSGQDYLQRTETDSWYTGSSELSKFYCNYLKSCLYASTSTYLMDAQKTFALKFLNMLFTVCLWLTRLLYKSFLM